MRIEIHPHARERMETRGASEAEIHETVREGEQFSAKHGRIGFRRDFPGEAIWRGKSYNAKQVEAYTVIEDDAVIVITVIVKYISESSP
jgi:hypothetical protein